MFCECFLQTCFLHTTQQGRPSPCGNDASPCFRFPPISEKFCRLCGKSPQSDLFPKDFRFSSVKVSDDRFLVIRHKFPISPLFSYFPVLEFPPYFGKFFFSPYFCKISLRFRKIDVIFHTLRVFRFPLLLPWCIYALHNAPTGRPCFTTLLCFVSTLLRLFVGLALPRTRMYAESHWRYPTFERYYTCSCSKLRYQTHQKVWKCSPTFPLPIGIVTFYDNVTNKYGGADKLGGGAHPFLGT